MFALFTFSACSEDDEQAIGDTNPTEELDNIVETAQGNDALSALVAALTTADLNDDSDLIGTLSGAGPFTVFAPTNDAFGMLANGTVDTLLKPENKATLTKVLTCHVVAADAMSMAIKGMVDDDGGTHPVPTVGGCTLQATYDGDTIMLEDERGRTAKVTIADVEQSNGVIHVIDTVLLPAM